MARSKSSKQWLREHFEDDYVRKSQDAGYRSRASFKLLEIQEKDRLIRPGMTVVDLGSAPGGWSQVAAELAIGGRVIATDILPMPGLAGVEFLQGDFTELQVYTRLEQLLGSQRADLVLSDMAPNMSGVRDIDQPAAMYLAELALDMAQSTLAKEGSFLVKVFEGEGMDAYQKSLRANFRQVRTRKPKSSRSRSREYYLLASGLK